VESQVDLIVGTFSKSFASLGGFVAGDDHVVHNNKQKARALMLSAAIHPAAAAAALAALEVIESEPQLRFRVQENADYVRSGLRRSGFETVDAQTPIVPVIIGDQDRMFRFWKALLEEGVFTNPVTVPAVPPGLDLIRTSYIATHTRQHLDSVLQAFSAAARRVGTVAPAPTRRAAAGDAS
jgi:7-keto-8-aminopelargonate synthetase-like enzyme